MLHCLKIRPDYFEAVSSGLKTFEFRRDDRNFQVGDVLCLQEWNGEHYGRLYFALVVYILRDFPGLMPGYAVLSIKRFNSAG